MLQNWSVLSLQIIHGMLKTLYIVHHVLASARKHRERFAEVDNDLDFLLARKCEVEYDFNYFSNCKRRF